MNYKNIKQSIKIYKTSFKNIKQAISKKILRKNKSKYKNLNKHKHLLKMK